MSSEVTKNVTSPVASRPDPLWEATQMDDLHQDAKVRQALFHVLGQIRSNPTVGYELGIGSQTFALLTEAYAALTGEAVRAVREHFYCQTAAKLTAAQFRGLAEKADPSSDYRERMLACARTWDTKVDELVRLRRGKQTLTIALP